MPEKKDDSDFEILEEASIDEDRYDRQKRIDGWDQRKIQRATVLIVGAGATGNEVIKNLVLTGIGRIILVDFDIIEKSNLNRCVLFNMVDSIENKYKVDVVVEAANKLNPETEIIGIKKDIKEINKKYYKQADVVCSCLDNIEARLQTNIDSYYYNVPFIDSGIDEFFGSVQAVYRGVEDSPCLECGLTNADIDLMYKKFSCTGQEIKSKDGETMGKMATIITTTAIIGGIQSQQVLKFILGIDRFEDEGKWNKKIGAPLIGKQLNYNGRLGRYDIIQKLKNPNCICSSIK